MTDCEHLKFEASVHVIRRTNGPDEIFKGEFAVDVAVHCVHCEQPLIFIGLPMGVDLARPSVSVDHRQARLPAEITFR